MKDKFTDGGALEPVPWFVEQARKIDAKPTPQEQPGSSDASLPAFLNDWPSNARQPVSDAVKQTASFEPAKEADHTTLRRPAKLRTAKKAPRVSQRLAAQPETKPARIVRSPDGSMGDALTADNDGVLPMRYSILPSYAETELNLGDGDQVLERLTDPNIEVPATPARERRGTRWVGAVALTIAGLLVWTGFEIWDRSIETRQAPTPLATGPTSSVAVTVSEPATLNEELAGSPAAGSKTPREPSAQEADGTQVATALPQRARSRSSAEKQSRTQEPTAGDEVVRLPSVQVPESQFATASSAAEALPSQEAEIANNRGLDRDAASVEQLALLARENEVVPPPAIATTPLSKPVRSRTVLPECKGFQVYRPTTPCRVGKPR